MNDRPEEQISPEAQASNVPSSPRRLSRRSAIKKAVGVTGLTLAAGAGGLLPREAAATRQSDATPYAISQMVLTDKDPLKQRVMVSASMQPLLGRYGASALNEQPAVHVKFHGTDVEAVSMVFQHPSQASRAVWAYFSPQHPDFKVIQFEFVPTHEMQNAIKAGERAALSGRATFLTSSDKALSSAIFRNDMLMATGAPAAGLEVEAWEDWGCFANCLEKEWSNLPEWLRVLCGAACGACIAHLLFACPACFACLGGFILGCFYICWR